MDLQEKVGCDQDASVQTLTHSSSHGNTTLHDEAAQRFTSRKRALEVDKAGSSRGQPQYRCSMGGACWITGYYRTYVERREVCLNGPECDRDEHVRLIFSRMLKCADGGAHVNIPNPPFCVFALPREHGRWMSAVHITEAGEVRRCSHDSTDIVSVLKIGCQRE